MRHSFNPPPNVTKDVCYNKCSGQSALPINHSLPANGDRSESSSLHVKDTGRNSLMLLDIEAHTTYSSHHIGSSMFTHHYSLTLGKMNCHLFNTLD